MTSNRPYLIRAIHQWITDNNETPYVIVNVDYAECIIPQEYAQSGTITLNLSYDATSNLEMDNDFISFSARFGGLARDVSFSPQAVIGIYARDTGQGMMFEPADQEKVESEVPAKTKKRAKLKLVSNSGKKKHDPK